MTQTATTPAPAEVAGAPRALFFTSASALPMLRGPMVAYAPEGDGGAAPDAGQDAGGEVEDADDADRAESDEAAEVEYDDDGNPIEPAEDLDEVEYEGKKYKLPKEMKRGFLREADYTQKTQALAQQRQAFDTERSQHAELTKTLRADIGRVQALEDRVEKFKAIPWDELRQADPDEWRELRDDYTVAQDQLRDAQASLKQKEDEFSEKERQADATRLAEVNSALADPKTGIPGWGEQVMRDLAGFAGQHGVSIAELQQFAAPHWKLLHLAHVGAQVQQKQQRVEQHKKTQETRPAAPIKGTGVARDLNSVKSTDEWMRQRNAQLRKRA